MAHWTEAFYNKLDSGDQSSVNDMASDISIQVANDPVVIGMDAAFAGAFGRIFGAINGMRHEVVSRHDVTPDRAIIEFMTHYTLKNDSEIAVPVVTIIERNEIDQIIDLRLYFDPSPLFSQ